MAGFDEEIERLMAELNFDEEQLSRDLAALAGPEFKMTQLVDAVSGVDAEAVEHLRDYLLQPSHRNERRKFLEDIERILSAIKK